MTVVAGIAVAIEVVVVAVVAIVAELIVVDIISSDINLVVVVARPLHTKLVPRPSFAAA